MFPEQLESLLAECKPWYERLFDHSIRANVTGDTVPSSADVRDALFRTLAANGMQDEAHIRLTLTRGEKITSGMNPRFNQSELK